MFVENLENIWKYEDKMVLYIIYIINILVYFILMLFNYFIW